MSKEKIILIVVGSLLVGVLIGGAGGVFISFRFLRNVYDSQQLLTTAQYGQYAYLQYRNATFPEAKAALRKYIDFWEELRGKEGRFVREGVYYVDTGLAYARLALLEEKFGKKEQARQYLTEARQRLENAGWKDTSGPKIREVVKTLDERGAWSGVPRSRTQ